MTVLGTANMDKRSTARIGLGLQFDANNQMLW